MAVTHPTSVRNSVCDHVVDKIDVGSSTAAGRLKFRTAGDVDVATLPMSNPAFGSASSGSATANAITSDSSAAGGLMAKFAIVDRDGNSVILGSVAASSGGDINMTSLTVSPGDTVSVASLVYTAMP